MDKYNLTKDIINQLASKVNTNYTKEESIVNGRIEGSRIKGHHLLAVFTGTNVGLQDALRELVKAKRYGFTFDVAFSESGTEIIDVDMVISQLQPRNVFNEKDKLTFGEIIEGVEGIIVPMTTQDTAAKLTLGIQDNFISTLLWQALWHGKSVLMDFQNVITYRGTPSMQPVLQQIVDSHVEKLQMMGIVRVEKKNYLVEMLGVFNGNKNYTGKTEDTLVRVEEKGIQEAESDRRVIITEKDLLGMSPHGKELTVPMRAIITPLAYDTAKELGIKIVKK